MLKNCFGRGKRNHPRGGGEPTENDEPQYDPKNHKNHNSDKKRRRKKQDQKNREKRSSHKKKAAFSTFHRYLLKKHFRKTRYFKELYPALKLTDYRQSMDIPMEKRGFVRFVIVSDTHSKHSQLVLPEGDVLLHTGDFTKLGTLKEVKKFSNWLGRQGGFKFRVVIAGNHEYTFDLEKEDEFKQGLAHYASFVRNELNTPRTALNDSIFFHFSTKFKISTFSIFSILNIILAP